MNKKIIKLSEGDLHKIVKESTQKILNEAYGTMPLSDFQKNVDIDNDDDEGMTLYNVLVGDFRKIERHINAYKNRGKGNSLRSRQFAPSNDTIVMYLEKMLRDLENAKKTLPMIKKLEIMETGEQPDENYYGQYSPNIPRGLSR